jgi:hypothetical protein
VVRDKSGLVDLVLLQIGEDERVRQLVADEGVAGRQDRMCGAPR